MCANCDDCFFVLVNVSKRITKIRDELPTSIAVIIIADTLEILKFDMMTVIL